MRCSPQVPEVLPVLYLGGVSTGNFREALSVLPGEDPAGLSATNITRLPAAWDEEYQAFRRRVSDCDFIYVRVDGIHFNIRLEDDRLCTLVMLGGAVRRHQGAGGPRGRLSGECGELAARAPGLAPAGTASAGDAGWRWRGRLLVGGARRLAGDDAATRLVPQDGHNVLC